MELKGNHNISIINIVLLIFIILFLLFCFVLPCFTGRKDDLISRLRQYTSRESDQGEPEVEAEVEKNLICDVTAEEDKENENDNNAFNKLTLEIANMKHIPGTKRKLLGNSANFAPIVVEDMMDYSLE
jgi:hypothetical protein